MLDLKQSTEEDDAHRGLLPSFKLGKHRRFLRAHVETRIAELLEPSETFFVGHGGEFGTRRRYSPVCASSEQRRKPRYSRSLLVGATGIEPVTSG